MALLTRVRKMAGRGGGRPKKDDGEQGTSPVRVMADLAVMISEVADALDKKTANLLDDLLRSEIESLHKEYGPEIERIRALDKEKAEVRAKASQKSQKPQSPTTRKNPAG